MAHTVLHRPRPIEVGSRLTMVKSGQVAQFGFSNPDRGQLGLEALDLGVLRRRLTGDTLTKVHRTDFHQLFVFTAGTATTMVDFVDHPCASGTLLHISPGRVLRLPTGSAEALMVLFTPAFPPPVLSPFGPVLHTVPKAELAVFSRAVQDVRQEYRRNLLTNEPVDLLRQLLGALLLRIARLPGDTPRHDPRFERFQQELERSFATTRNAAEYAARIGYSTRSLNRICLAATGQSAKALIDARVTLEAKRLLVHTGLSSAAIGHRLGFSEATNFTKFFVRETGVSPGAFRE
ncbi:AraC family transcriptional regulator [Lentzea sp. NEAU-D7]|uniref:AraC family transcriptional regulator n=1 Tax=Lentzea sp. NEAU-D7 TaxID=2994667 RepID=UPI00224AB272|nr:helix-turn-helix domain-containing protein [Lentzea sp. NEAU-D7]MCX2947174.1 helix-turn-helix domain-containing protein [Lentzea sp. NEAU-D7]